MRELFDYLDHIISLKYGVADKEEPERTRLLHRLQGSCKPEFDAFFALIEAEAKRLLKAKQLLNRDVFLKALHAMGVPVLAVWNSGRSPVPGRGVGQAGPGPIKSYPGTITVLAPNQKQMILGGALCQFEFTDTFWGDRLRLLADNVAQRRKDPVGYFNKFLTAVERWAEQQRAAYPHAGRLGKPVGAADFEVLRPAPPKLIMCGPSMEM